jgi:predicted nucleotidyltransferase
MDLTDPTKSITSTLDGPVLAALATSGRALSVSEVAMAAARGSELGVRKSLARLVQQGVVIATEIGNRRIYSLNSDHVAAPIARQLADLRLTLWGLMRGAVAKWRPTPFYACVFGSAARGDGSEESDIDILLIHAPRQGERYPKRGSRRAQNALIAVSEEMLAVPLTARDFERWTRNADKFRESVRGWTGNRVQLLQMSIFEWRESVSSKSAISEEILRDAVVLYDKQIIKTEHS